MLDPALLQEARQLLGTKTYSETVNKALAEAIRITRIRMLPDLLGKVTWVGDLSAMREDKPRKRSKRKKPA